MSAWEQCVGATDDWYTPAYIFKALGCRFSVDVSAPREGPRHVPCDDWLWRDSLDLPWAGFVWMNPPFGKRNGLEPWLDKFIAHGNGICLVPDRTSAPWFQSAARVMDRMLFVSPKIRFERPDGSTGNSPGTGTVLMSIGWDGNRALGRGATLGFLATPQAPPQRFGDGTKEGTGE